MYFSRYLFPTYNKLTYLTFVQKKKKKEKRTKCEDELSKLLG